AGRGLTYCGARAHRKPARPLRYVTTSRSRFAARTQEASFSPQPPPRITRYGLMAGLSGPLGARGGVGESLYGPCQSATHSPTLPAMSSAPKGLAPSGYFPTGAVDSAPSSPSYITDDDLPRRATRALHSLPQALSNFGSGLSLPQG